MEQRLTGLRSRDPPFLSNWINTQLYSISAAIPGEVNNPNETHWMYVFILRYERWFAQ